MAWHSGKPADNDFLSVSVQHIRENFAELEPLHPHIAELVDLTTLHPHITELVDLTALQPHVAALLDSRIVDHNLDVADPPNGWYVRGANGLQMCYFLRVSSGRSITAAFGALFSDIHVQQWTFPAAFSVAPLTLGMVQKDSIAHPYLKAVTSATNSLTYVAIAPQSGTFDLVEHLFAIGVGAA